MAPEWVERYRGAFDHGYDEQRRATLARQIEKGLVPEGTQLSPWPADVPRWDELTEDERVVSARFMETYAGFAEHADTHVGRLVDELEASGQMASTVFVYLLGDNGASGEGGIHGAVAEHTVGHGFQESTADQLAALDRLGDPTTYPIYPVGWALAMNTPYQWTKVVASHLGATRDGMVLRWDDGIVDRGTIRHQWHHVIDLLPTFLDVAGVPAPLSIDGADQSPLHGLSMRYTFDDPGAPDRRRNPVLRDGREPGDLPRRLDRGDQARPPVGGRGGEEAALRRRPVGAVRPDHRLEPGPRPRRLAPGPAGRAAAPVPDRGQPVRRLPAGRPDVRAPQPR